MWKQTRQTLQRWVHITMVGYGPTQLLSCLNNQTANTLCHLSPWRKKILKQPDKPVRELPVF